ncbi:MAG: hypothetical protein GX375_09340 [Clostridiales bacterium]|nr:hypothetical protein [Clostridiales bacterium]
MRKRWLVLFIILSAFAIVVSTEIDLQHILAGMLLGLLGVWFWQDLGGRLPHFLYPKELLLLGRCLILLIWYIIESNIAVAKTLLSSNPPVNPVFLVVKPDIKSNWGRILLATCITITPGTVTIDIDPETGQFIVHALTEEAATGLSNWRMIDEIKSLEVRMQRGANHVVDTGRIDDINSSGTLASHHRTNSH